MCINCKNTEVKKVFIIKNRKYGSEFDYLTKLNPIKIPLCEECIKNLKVKEDWFTEKPIKDGYTYMYKFEKEIKKLIYGINCNL